MIAKIDQGYFFSFQSHISHYHRQQALHQRHHLRHQMRAMADIPTRQKIGLHQRSNSALLVVSLTSHTCTT